MNKLNTIFLTIFALAFGSNSCAHAKPKVMVTGSACHAADQTQTMALLSSSSSDEIGILKNGNLIEDGVHGDLFSRHKGAFDFRSNGIIESKKYKWKTNVGGTGVFLLYEDENYVLVNSFYDPYNLRTYLNYYFVIRKKDGKIVNEMKTPLTPWRVAVIDKIFYVIYEDKLYCMDVNE